MATAKGGNFPTLSFLPVSRRPNDPLPSVTVSSSDDHLSSSHSSTGSTLYERNYSQPDATPTTTAARPQLQHSLSTPHTTTTTTVTTVTESIRNSAISSYDEEEDFVTSDVFTAGLVGVQDDHSAIVDDCKESNGVLSDGEATLTIDNKDDEHQPMADVETPVDEEAAYFVLEKPSKLKDFSSDKDSPGSGDKAVTTPAYEEIDEETVNAIERPRSPLPYETPSWFRQESCDAYYSNIGSPDTSGYTLLSQWTRCKSEDDYTRLDPSTLISKPATDDNIYSQLKCSIHLGKREVLEPLSEKVCLSIKDIVREIHLYLGKSSVQFSVSALHCML